MKSFDERLKDIFRNHEPYRESQEYPRGNTIIRELAEIANAKHTVGFHVAAAQDSVTIPAG